jgi:hypothetical protein
MNLVDLVKGYLTPDMLGKLSSVLGESPDRTQAAVGAAVPTLLAGLASVSGSPEGARRLASALDDQDERVLGNFGNVLSGGASFAEKGGSMLNSLMGGSTLGTLSSVLSKFTGLGGPSITSLLGMLAPLVMGVLGKQRSTLGLDASGLANLLAGQRENIAGSMPAGLSEQLGSVPGLGNWSDAARSAAGSVASAGRNAASTAASYAGDTYRAAERTAYAAAPRKSVFTWLLPLLILGVGAIILFRWWGGPATTTASTPPKAVVPAASQVTRLTNDFSGFFADATKTLSGITDAPSADAAIPKLNDLGTRLGGLKNLYSNLAGTDRGTINSTIAPLAKQFRDLVNKVLAMPTIGDKLRPTLQPILDNLSSFGA